jgi:hypothetical protein
LELKTKFNTLAHSDKLSSKGVSLGFITDEEGGKKEGEKFPLGQTFQKRSPR